MTGLHPGDIFPANVTFSYIPTREEESNGAVAGVPIKYEVSKGVHATIDSIRDLLIDLSSEFGGKRVVLVSTPGAFTGTCSEKHLPGYIQHLERFKALGVDQVAIVAYNDPYVMSAWQKDNGVKGSEMVRTQALPCRQSTDVQKLFLSDTNTAFARQIGWTKGERTGRFAMVVESGRVIYAKKEPGSEVTVSSAEEVLNFLGQL